MAYWENKAALKSNGPEISTGAAAEKRSNQEQSQPQTSKFRTVSFDAKPGVRVGNQVKVQANTKGTGVVGRPSSIAELPKDKKDPAVVNPSGSRNWTSKNYSGKM